MKKIFIRIRTFISFYLIIPSFVLGVLIAGFSLPQASVVVTSAADFQSTALESPVQPTAVIEGEVGIPVNSYPIIARDLSKSYNILNETNEVISEDELLTMALPHGNQDPLVLVVHTHGTECYAEDSSSFKSADTDGNYGYYSNSTRTRTENTDKNVIAVGEAFCTELAEHGIQAIQCRTMHDKEDYNSAYANSRNSISEYLEKFPSIKYVIDLHRDSLGGGGKEKFKTVATGLENTAQVMTVAGCNGNGVVYPHWKENLSVALKYKKVMDTKYPSLSRPIYLRYSRYNLDLAVGSLLLEIGSCGNTLEEALNAARLAAECFAEMLK